jgi:hypothetical protein
MPSDVVVIKKYVAAVPGNSLELQTQIDGASVDLKEAKEYVAGKILKTYVGKESGKPVQIKALEFTRKGDEEFISVIHSDSTVGSIQKKYLAPTELFEYGVYNSEMDVKSNPKTGENAPDLDAAVVGRVTERLKEIAFSINDIILFVKDNSSLSHDSLDKCVNEINSYISSLENEKQDSIIN